MSISANRAMVAGTLIVSLALLLPGLFFPVLTIRGVLTREGVAHVAPMMLDKGLNPETMKQLTSMLNPSMVGMVEAMGMDLRSMIIEKLSPELTASLQKSVEDVQVYEQTRSIISAVQNLYDVGAPIPATLILLFSVVVPLTKAALVAWATFLARGAARLRTLRFVELIAKWSMADVFVVALFITYLAAQASQAPTGPDAAPPLLAFTAEFRSGFYWFAAYCVFSLASQQWTARVAAADAAA